MAKWRVVAVCPVHGRKVHFTVEAKDLEEAERKALGMLVACPYPPTHKFHVEKIVAVMPYPAMLETVTMPVTGPRPPVPREAPTRIVKASRYAVTLAKGKATLTVSFPKSEIETFDRLMRTAKAADQASLRNAILAFLITHGGGTKSLITAFLQASGFLEATPSTVGEALARLKRQGIIYRYPTVFAFTYHPLGVYGKAEKKTTSEIMGEPVYGMPEPTRLRILERLKFEPYLPWWRMIRPPPPILEWLRKPVQYEWVKIQKPTPRFTAAEDLKHYGPYKKGAITKLPLTFAYFLVRSGYAEWLNPTKQNVKEIEKIFKYKTIEKIRRQATLLEF